MDRRYLYIIAAIILFVLFLWHLQVYSELHNEDVTKSVRVAIEKDATLAPFSQDVFISTFDGVVTLSGTVDSEFARTSIENKAKTIVGYNKVVNNIVVRYGNVYRQQ
jgi:osmotically-inducible protein OsmY